MDVLDPRPREERERQKEQAQQEFKAIRERMNRQEADLREKERLLQRGHELAAADAMLNAEVKKRREEVIKSFTDKYGPAGIEFPEFAKDMRNVERSMEG